LTVTHSHNISDWETLSKKLRNKFIVCAQAATCLAQSILSNCSALRSILHPSKLWSPEQWTESMICMGRTELKKSHQMAGAHWSGLQNFTCLAGFTPDEKNNKLAGRKCRLPYNEQNLEWWRMPSSPLKGLMITMYPFIIYVWTKYVNTQPMMMDPWSRNVFGEVEQINSQ
jgi:hypothetical protein